MGVGSKNYLPLTAIIYVPLLEDFHWVVFQASNHLFAPARRIPLGCLEGGYLEALVAGVLVGLLAVRLARLTILLDLRLRV